LKKLGMSVDDAFIKIAMLEDIKFKQALANSIKKFNKFQKADIKDRAKMLGMKIHFSKQK